MKKIYTIYYEDGTWAFSIKYVSRFILNRLFTYNGFWFDYRTREMHTSHFKRFIIPIWLKIR